MLLLKVHSQLQIWKVNGAQTKYAGHTILFPRDNGSLITQLPLLPSDLDVLIIRNKSAPAANEDMARRPEFQVKRSRLLANLQALCHFHPSYRQVTISYENLQLLSDNDTVFNSFIAVDHDGGTWK